LPCVAGRSIDLREGRHGRTHCRHTVESCAVADTLSRYSPASSRGLAFAGRCCRDPRRRWQGGRAPASASIAFLSWSVDLLERRSTDHDAFQTSRHNACGNHWLQRRPLRSAATRCSGLHIGRSPLAQARDIGSSNLKPGSAPFSTLLRFVDCLQEAGAKNVTIRQLKN
jgi:hypothetical protein